MAHVNFSIMLFTQSSLLKRQNDLEQGLVLGLVSLVLTDL